MRAWLDRPLERAKDLNDLAHLLDAYLSADDEQRWHDDVVALGLTFEEVSPFLLGQDLGRIASASHRDHIEEFLGKVPPDELRPRLSTFSELDDEHNESAHAALARGFRVSSNR